jgi:hypothetical protein
MPIGRSVVPRKPWLPGPRRSRPLLPFRTTAKGWLSLTNSTIEARLGSAGCDPASRSDAQADLAAKNKSYCGAVLAALVITSSRAPNPFGLLAISGLACYAETMSCMPAGQTRSDVS